MGSWDEHLDFHGPCMAKPWLGPPAAELEAGVSRLILGWLNPQSPVCWSPGVLGDFLPFFRE